jgi:hypothetical protein
MRFREFFPVAAACLSLQGCLEVETRPRPDLEEPPDLSQPDLAPPCAAASGLPGDNLLCVDFSAIPEGSLGTSLPAQLSGWNFANAVPDCWEIKSGKLQVVNFAGFMSDCRFTMPAINLNDADKQKYAGLTLAIVHRVDLSEADQKIQVMLGQDDPNKRLVTQWTGRQQRQVSTIALMRADLPTAVSGMVQPLLKVSSVAPYPFLGWQIESIAINARR